MRTQSINKINPAEVKHQGATTEDVEALDEFQELVELQRAHARALWKELQEKYQEADDLERIVEKLHFDLNHDPVADFILALTCETEMERFHWWWHAYDWVRNDIIAELQEDRLERYDLEEALGRIAFLSEETEANVRAYREQRLQ